MARHAARHRVDRVLDRDALGLQRGLELAHGVLGLGHGHAVAGRDDHLARVGELDGDVFGAGVERCAA